MRSFVFLGLFFTACVSDSTVTPTDGGTDTSVPTDAAADSTQADSGKSDAADAAGDEETSVPWDPSQLAGLALWLEGDTAVPDTSSKISSWLDQSTNHNNATQSNESLAPYLASTNINGHQAVHFKQTFLMLADSASLEWKASFIIEVIVRHAQATMSEEGTLYEKQNENTSPYAGPQLTLNATSSSPFGGYAQFEVDTNAFITTQAQPAIDANPHRVRASWDATASTMSLQLDTGAPVVKTETGTSGIDSTGFGAQIGAGSQGFFPYTGDIAEIIAVAATTLNGGDITKLEAYLDTKYGL